MVKLNLVANCATLYTLSGSSIKCGEVARIILFSMSFFPLNGSIISSVNTFIAMLFIVISLLARSSIIEMFFISYEKPLWPRDIFSSFLANANSFLTGIQEKMNLLKMRLEINL